MSKTNAKNERIKREYVRYLEEARGRNASTVDRVLKSIVRFEESTRRKDFRAFHREQAVAFKRQLSAGLNSRTGDRLSKATVHSTLRDLHAFFFWLAHLPGYKSQIGYSDADYFNLSDKDVAIARGRREKRVPTLAQVEHVLSSMPVHTEVERRNRAVLAYALVTGARAAALASFQIGDLNIADGFIDQDARHVQTKFSKTFRTYLMPVSELAMSITREWHEELTADPLRNPQDSLFPATQLGLSNEGVFKQAGLARQGWSSTGPIREIFKDAFEAAGLQYFNPHSIRDMLVRHVVSLNLPAEMLKCWSQNLGHEGVLTTLTSYGRVPTDRQGELIKKGLPKTGDAGDEKPDPRLVAALAEALQEARRLGA